MADQGSAGSMAGAHEAAPISAGVPVGVNTVQAPKGELKLGTHSTGIGCSRRGAH